MVSGACCSHDSRPDNGARTQPGEPVTIHIFGSSTGNPSSIYTFHSSGGDDNDATYNHVYSSTRHQHNH